MQNLGEILGLTAAEESAYLCCLQQGPLSVTEIATITGGKRPTLYPVLRSLADRRYLVVVPRGKRMLYDAAPPSVFRQALQRRAQDLETLLPDLERRRLGERVLPEVTVVRPEGVADLYERVYASMERGERVWFLTSIADVDASAPWVLDRYRDALARTAKPDVRELIRWDAAGKAYLRRIRAMGFAHPCRLLPKTMQVSNDIVIFGSVAAILSFSRRQWGVEIAEKHIAASMRTLYEGLWAGAIAR